MEQIKKIEIVINAYQKETLVSLFRKNQIDRYTLIEDVKGKGNRGWQDGDGLTESFKNVYFMLACKQDDFERLKEPLKNILKKGGGICMVSDCSILTN